ncbi:hypothetical protein EBT31_19955 [bacterium]|jgi:hypothetical protein|nr:hypothetical protein [bacterium]
MLGILLVLLSMSSLGAASYRIGGITSKPQTTETEQTYNVSLVVVAISFMLALCGALMISTGWNPFADLSNMATPKSNALSLL